MDSFLSAGQENKASLLASLKQGFLATLTHAEEKVSLAAQCYNAVEKHLCKLEDDLKCFEEEIRLAGYEELLAGSRQRNKHSSMRDGNSTSSRNTSNSSTSNSNNNKKRSRPAEKQQEKPVQAAEQGTKRTRRTSLSAPSTTSAPSDDESANTPPQTELSRAERLLRRTKPTLQADESVEKSNEGDDEGESAHESEPEEPKEPEQKPEDENEKDDPKDEPVELKQENSASEKAEEPVESEPVIPVETSQPKRSTRSRSNSVSTAAATPNSEPLYCTCKRVSFGQMIACDNKDCPVEWFHYACVGLKTPPKGKWFCSKDCQDRKKRK